MEPRFFSRAWSLQQLHENAQIQFARAAGFGPMRMPSIQLARINLEPRTPLNLPLPIAITTPTASSLDIAKLHRTTVADFADRERIGYVRSLEEVAGFESHQLSSKASHQNWDAKPNWQVIRLELLSVIREGEPCVFVSKSLPDLEKLPEAPTGRLMILKHQPYRNLCRSKISSPLSNRKKFKCWDPYAQAKPAWNATKASAANCSVPSPTNSRRLPIPTAPRVIPPRSDDGS